MTQRFWRTATSAGLLVSLIGAGWYGTPARQAAHASRLAALGCNSGSASVSPSSGSLNGAQVKITASGLDKSSQAFVTLYDVQNHAQYLTGLTNAQTDGSGNFSAMANLPRGGLAGGTDTLIVSDNTGQACVSGTFSVSPAVQVLGQPSGYAFTFQGAQFHSASTITINYIDSAQKTNPIAGLQLPTTGLGQTSGYSVPIPASAAIGDGTLQFVDTASGGSTVTAPFHYSGPPPPTNTPLPYTYVPPTYSTDVPGTTGGSGGGGGSGGSGGSGGGSGGSGNPGSQGSPTSTFTPVGGIPTGTRTPGTSTPTPTSTPVGSTNFPGSPTAPSTGFATSTPTGGGLGQAFPTATPTPRSGDHKPTPTPTKGKPKPVFPTPTPRGGSKGQASACKVKHCLTNGNFEQKLASWTVNSPKQVVSVDSVHVRGSKHAARLTGTTKPAVLSQGFTAQSSIHQVSFYFRNTGAKATAQIVDGKKTLIAQHLPTTRGKAFASVVLKLPQKIKAGDTLVLTFSAIKGSLFVDDVVVGIPPPAKKAAPKDSGHHTSPTATPRPTATPIRPTATPGKPQPVFPTPTPKTS